MIVETFHSNKDIYTKQMRKAFSQILEVAGDPKNYRWIVDPFLEGELLSNYTTIARPNIVKFMGLSVIVDYNLPVFVFQLDFQKYSSSIGNLWPELDTPGAFDSPSCKE